MITMGMSPRGTVALTAIAKASAYIKGRDYVIPEDIKEVFLPVVIHRIQVSAKAKVGHIKPEEMAAQVLEEVKTPSIRKQ